ncbi:hypothetical protein [Lentilactobacillus sp. SPB1-3]|uniref:Uncharacterized protein n=1 Tax=Lentilactobacillus terminaliae TaxID=3003483 RepID=A0ACD5DCH7_9LACO|nr:hypothetical protein [Lentilactobacillus sp. SPB1-3]MCZ0977434.1 hypothetical protein [Lentilactobacillus sp. SPB1-3]
MGVQLLDIITKLASYAMVICFGLFAYYKITDKSTNIHYGRYALLSLIIMIMFGTAFFLTPQGQHILKTGDTSDTVLSGSAKKKAVIKNPVTAVTKTYNDTNNLIFKHPTEVTLKSKKLNVTVADSRDTNGSLKLATAEILTTLKQSNLKDINNIQITYRPLNSQKTRLKYQLSKSQLINSLPKKVTTNNLNKFAN